MDNKINNNGYDYVDLELPSRTLWSTCNVGAKKPSDFGQYFQWVIQKDIPRNKLGKINSLLGMITNSIQVEIGKLLQSI